MLTLHTPHETRLDAVCAFIADDSKQNCGRTVADGAALFEVYLAPGGPDDVTQACGQHLAAIIGDVEVQHVDHIESTIHAYHFVAVPLEDPEATTAVISRANGTSGVVDLAPRIRVDADGHKFVDMPVGAGWSTGY